MYSRRMMATACIAMLCWPLAHAQSGRFFPPTGNGDGIRYPLVFSPVVWEVEGPVAVAHGSDGLVHLAYTLRITNVFGGPVEIGSLEVVDPFAGYKEIGTNRVVATDKPGHHWAGQSCSCAARPG